MSSSSYRLIHPQPDPSARLDEPAPGARLAAVADVAAAEPAGQGGRGQAAVLRGRGRGSSAPAIAHGPSGASAPVIAGVPEGIDPAELAEELRRLEAEAEQRGYEAGRARAIAELQAAVAGAGALAARLQETAPDRTADIAHSIAELALSVAKRILQHEVRSDPAALCNALEAAVGTINGSPEAHVLLNPAAVDGVRAAWEALHGRAYLGKRWTFEGDPTLPLGGCTLRYEHGFVEAGLEAQLEEIGIALDRAIPALSRSTADEDVA